MEKMVDVSKVVELERRIEKLEYQLERLASIVKSTLSILGYTIYREKQIGEWVEDKILDRRSDIDKLLEELRGAES